jgi:NitT/TauT family transport system substrate-binding protein
MRHLAPWPRRTLWLLIASALVLLPLAPWGSLPAGRPLPGAAPVAAASAPPAVLPQSVHLRFGSPGSVSDAGVILGDARGNFREQGIDLEFVPFQSALDTAVPLASGDLAAAGGVFGISLLNAVDRGLALKAVADKGGSGPGFEFVQVPVRSDLLASGEVRTPQDLRGHRIAMTATRSGGELVVARMLAQQGVGIDEVELVTLGYPDMLAAFGNRAIDAALVIEPTLTAGVARGLFTAWEPGRSSSAMGGPYQAGLLYYGSQLQGQPDLARRFMVGYLQGVRAYNDAFGRGEGRADAVRVLAEQTAVKDPALYDQMQMPALDPDGRINRASLQAEIDYYRARGYYTGSATLDSVVDSSFAESAAQALGPYR